MPVSQHVPTHGTSLLPYPWHRAEGAAAPAAFQIKTRAVPAHLRWHPVPRQPSQGGPWRLPGLIHRALQASGLWCPSAWGPMGVPEPPTWPTTATHLQQGQPRLQEGDTNPACPGTIGISDVSAAGVSPGPAGTHHRPGQTPRHQPGTLLGRRTSWDWHAGATASPGGGSERHHGGQQASHEPGPRCRELLNKHPLFGRWFV